MTALRYLLAALVVLVAMRAVVYAVGDRPTVSYGVAALGLAFVLGVCLLMNRWLHR